MGATWRYRGALSLLQPTCRRADPVHALYAPKRLLDHPATIEAGQAKPMVVTLLIPWRLPLPFLRHQPSSDPRITLVTSPYVRCLSTDTAKT